jgi:hypothetical protein
MARRHDDRPRSLDEAVAQLKRDPRRAVHARVDDLDLELRVVDRPANQVATDVFEGIGPWEGETSDELIRRLHEDRARYGTDR